jgi:hypothetical protein
LGLANVSECWFIILRLLYLPSAKSAGLSVVLFARLANVVVVRFALLAKVLAAFIAPYSVVRHV